MEHPPIPPNCKHFDSGVHPYFVLDCGDEICLITTARWRPIISAVARCAWLDEAKKHGDKADELARWTTHEKLYNESMDGRRDALLNADAWAAWGKS